MKVRNLVSGKTVVAFLLAASVGRTAALYTFSNTGSDPYSFSILEPDVFETSGAFGIAPITVGGVTFTGAAFGKFGVSQCFVFGTPGVALTGIDDECSASPNSSQGGWLSFFTGANAPGTYVASYTSAGGIAPTAPNQLTITEVSAVLYTFSNTGRDPYSFSLLEPGYFETSGAFGIAPITVGGATFTEAAFGNFGVSQCFVFGTPGVPLTGIDDECSDFPSSSQGGWVSFFTGANAPGTYLAGYTWAGGIAPPAPDQLTITPLPEPASLLLLLTGLTGVLVISRFLK